MFPSPYPILNVNLDKFVTVFTLTLLERVVIPDTFNDDIHVVLFDKVVVPEIFNDDIHDVLFDSVVNPDTFNDDTQVVLLFNVVNPDTFNDDINVVLYVALVYIAPLNTAGNLKDLSVDVQSNPPVGFIDTIG